MSGGERRSLRAVKGGPTGLDSMGTVSGRHVAGSVPADEELIRRIVAGEVDLFAEVITRYQRHVGRIVAGHVPREMVEEVAHEVFVRAYTSLPTYSFRTPLAHWLATIAVRGCYDMWRGAASRKEVPISGMEGAHQEWTDRLLVAESDERFERIVQQQETTELLRWALARLSAENRMVVTLVHLEGYSVREAAELLGWNVVTIKVRAHRARRQLRRVLEGALRDPA